MPHVEWSVEWGDVLGALGALILIGGAVFAAWKVVNPIAAKFTRVADLILGRPDEQGIPGQPSMMDRFDAQDERLKAIERQITPNHGTSAHDKLAKRIDSVGAQVDAILVHLGIEPPA